MKSVGIYFIFLWLTCLSAWGQVGINTTTPRAQLEIASTMMGGGFLVPQYALTGNVDITTVRNPQGGGASLVPGTIIYNTNATTGVNGLSEGLVTWDGTEWKLIGDTGTPSTGWSLNGNATSATDFLGTTNSQPLVFRVDGNVVSEYKVDETFTIGFGASATGTNSLAIGRDASATTGNAIAIGEATLADNLNAIAIGQGAQATLEQSIGIGNDASAFGQNAVALGNRAEGLGQNAISIGNNSMADGINAIAIGQGAEATAVNAIAIGNTTLAPNNNTIILGVLQDVGIGTNDPQAKLDLRGTLRFQDGSEGTGRVLTSDASGNATWAAAGSVTPVYGQIFKQADQSGVNVSDPIIFGTSSISDGTTLSSNHITTGATTGVYRITYTINVRRINSVDSNIAFFLTQGAGAANKIAGSSGWVSVRGGAIRNSVTKSILVQVTAANQEFYVYPATTNADIEILEESSLLVELVHPD